jgi:hypothetical protein
LRPRRERLSSDGGAKIARHALQPVSGWKPISRYPTVGEINIMEWCAFFATKVLAPGDGLHDT